MRVLTLELKLSQVCSLPLAKVYRTSGTIITKYRKTVENSVCQLHDGLLNIFSIKEFMCVCNAFCFGYK